MLGAFLPKGAPFFELLLRQNAIMCAQCALISRLLETGIPGGHDLRPEVARLEEETSLLEEEASRLEEEADRVYLTIIKSLSQTFITPIDREDLLRMAKEQENMADLAQNLMARLYVFSIASPPFPMRKLGHNLHKMALLTSSMLRGLSEGKDSHDTRTFRELRIESEMLISSGLGEILDSTDMTPQSVFATLKLTRAFDRLEQAHAQMTELAEAIEEAVLKNV